MAIEDRKEREKQARINQINKKAPELCFKKGLVGTKMETDPRSVLKFQRRPFINISKAKTISSTK